MIKLKKGNEPQTLVANGAAWTKTLTDNAAAGIKSTNTEKTRYRHPDIKAALVQETHGKCAYCESKLRHIHHGDVEHIMPKSLALDKILEWANLTLACEICNQNKSDRDPNAEHLIDPYVDNPSDHLMFAGGLAFAKGTDKGTCTRDIIDLNRGDLVERRTERLDSLTKTMETVFRTSLPVAARRAIFKNLVARDIVEGSPYSAMGKAFVDAMVPLLPCGSDCLGWRGKFVIDVLCRSYVRSHFHVHRNLNV